jgi:hypothetical protein
MENNIQVIITGFKTIEEAQQWCSAYSGGVEQDMDVWAEKPGGGRKFPVYEKFTKVENNNVIMELTHPDEYGK